MSLSGFNSGMAIVSTSAPVSHYLILFLKQNDQRGEYFSEGSLGFGEEYVAGNIIVEGDFKALMQVRNGTEYSGHEVISENKIDLID